MRLAAIYIPKGKQFKGDTINFGGRYSYNVKQNLQEVKITRKENEIFINNFFSNDISNISAIVGKNGVGKTTLIKKILKDDNLFLIFENDILGYENDWFVASSNEYTNISVGIKRFIKRTNEIRIAHADLLDTNQYGYSLINQVNNTPSLYYYSPLSNFNLSTKYIDDFIINDNSVFIIKSEILQRQVQFLLQKDLIKKLNEIYDDFPSYEKIEIKLEELINPDISNLDFRFYALYKNNTFLKNKGISDLEKDKELKEAYSKDIEKREYTDIFSRLSKKSKQSSGRERIYIEIYIRLLLSLICLTGFKKLNQVLSEINNDIEDKIFGSDVEFNDFVEKNINKTIAITENTTEFSTIEELGGLKKSIKEILINMPENQYYSTLDLKLNLLYKSYFYFLKLTDLHASDFIYDYEIPFLKFETDKNLSQGEEYLLNLFSSIFSKEELGNKKNIILILDEPDLGFHPKWKKKLIESLVKVLPILINNITPKDLDAESFDNEENKHFDNLQIIFTTHNPLTLSDIPNNNIIYLDKKDNIFFINQTNRPQKSFGANITDLLADSFFVEDGLIGEFAKNKIQDVIEYINYKDKRVEKKWITSHEVAKKVIDQIGEPYLSEKLNDMFLEAFPEFKVEEIKRLEEKIKKLKDDTNSNK